MNEVVVKLGGGGGCQAAIKDVEIGQIVMLIPDRSGGLEARNRDGRILGKLTKASPIAQSVNGGEIVLHSSVNSISTSAGANPALSIRLRVVTGGRRDRYIPPPVSPPRDFMVAIAGVSNYQAAVRRTAIGSVATLEPEPSNRHDKRAVCVRNALREVVGYLPRDGWLTNAILDEEKSVQARVKSVGRADNSAMLGVVLRVTCQ